MLTVFLAYLVSALRFTVAAGLTLLKRWLKLTTPVTCHCQNRVREKVVIVTGSSSGIGHSTALDLAKKGAVVYLAFRNHKAGDKAVKKLRKATGNQAVYFLHLDLTDFSSIRVFVEAFLKCERRLDALVNNAAVFHHPAGLTCNEIEITYQTNYLGVVLLTTLLLNVIERPPETRVVFVTSEAHKLASPEELILFNPKQSRELETFADHVKNYGISKLALHLFAQHLSQTVPGVSVALVDPGNVWTPIYRHSWQSWSEIFTRINCFIFMRGVEEGAQSTIHALNAPHLVNGVYINNHLDSEDMQSYNSETVQQLMTTSSVLVGLPQGSLSAA
ncbi:retinol dehydrogenase 11-like [Homarus americanus]|uniref:retinol dehydrogenase 11-like n=1 Tax=Homarus americanus TaxID=6706 RepID=UPI001C441AB3|nr:retinol dehydrogenase 11-like [Homarus americanus]XP_042212628.1 retinol dehydrogenase 11-like [Homarus americanus]XP_042212629.1 retinol dehydrogenase 11-like [Homarus americanus]XP_042212630.1 retinol dehydrogenase 11-like [Homarus americanus]XP_042212631.1 retinol dehydrogenase 11-like [Homarus americanus]